MRSVFCLLASLLLLLAAAAAAFDDAKSNAASTEKENILREVAGILKDLKTDSNDAEHAKVAKETSGFEDILFNDIAVEQLDKLDDKPSCKNVDSDDKCFEQSKKGLCKSADVKKKCPRTCLTCCADFSASRCKSLEKFCFIKRWEQRMKHLCPKTCKYCGTKMPAPPPCLSSTFGCCWDKSTFAAGPIGSGTDKCPECKNTKAESFCEIFKPDCHDLHLIKGRQIRSYCPKTCRLCGPNKVCQDYPTQQHQHSCSGYKLEGLCETSATIMRFYCAKTCGFCKCTDNPIVNCLFLKKHRACIQSPDRMKKWCPLTCGFCKGDKNTLSGNSVNSVTK